MDSILTSIKKLLGIAEEYDHFDADLIMHINSVLMILTQLGVGPSNGFMIEDESATWNSFVPDSDMLAMVKSYMFMKVKLLFDPPLGSAVMESYNRQISEFEWRLNAAVDFNGGEAPADLGEAVEGVLFKDRVTGKTHELYVSDGDLRMSGGER